MNERWPVNDNILWDPDGTHNMQIFLGNSITRYHMMFIIVFATNWDGKHITFCANVFYETIWRVKKAGMTPLELEDNDNLNIWSASLCSAEFIRSNVLPIQGSATINSGDYGYYWKIYKYFESMRYRGKLRTF